MIKKIWATKGIYEIVIKAIKNRENSGISQEDTLQMLLDTGDEKIVLVGVSFFFFFFKHLLIYFYSHPLLTDKYV